ncbi:MAG: T9SS type A sorting domain-containing protein [Bacteroidota bacterium]
MLKKLVTLNVIALLCAHALQAQIPYLVKDLNPGAGSSFNSAPSGINAVLDKIVIFTAQTPNGLFQIMGSDGTEAGTQALLPPFSPDSLAFSGFVIQDNKCWFLEYNSSAGSKLYATDGTTAGTTLRLSDPGQLLHLAKFKSDLLFQKVPPGFDPQLLVRFHPADNSFYTVYLFDWFAGLRDFTVTANDTIYAIGGDTNGRNLYKGDGSLLNMTLVKQLNTGSEANSSIYMTPVGNKVYFFWQKTDTNEPYKLWVSDGTAVGTIGLKEFEIPSFQDLRAERALIEFSGKLYFRGKSPSDGKGFELYVSNGTVSGTKLVKDMNSGLADGEPKDLTIFKNKLWISARNDYYNPYLWQLSGNTATVQLTSLGFNFVAVDLNVFNDSLVMNGSTATDGLEIFFSQGTAASTKVLTDFSAPDGGQFSPNDFWSANGIMYFTAATGTNGRELWAYRPAPPVATHTPVNEIEVNIAPNPVQDHLFIAAPDAENVQVADVTGKIMYSGKFDQQLKLNTASWPVGMYQLVVWGAKGRSVRGVVKM